MPTRSAGIARSTSASSATSGPRPRPSRPRSSPRAGAGYRTATVRRAIAARIRWNDEPTEDLSTADRIDPRVLSADARRDPARRARRGDRLRQLPGLPERLPGGARRVRLLHDPGVPVDRPRAGDGHRRRPGPTAPAAGRRARRRRRADGRERARHRRPPRPADGGRSSTTTRATAPRSTTSDRTPRPIDLRVPRHRHRGDRAGVRLRRRDGAHARRPRRRAAVGGGAAAGPLLVDAKVLKDHPSWWLEEAFRGH